ncbi:hypothetical protein [Oharaeibacter diazotrophicus]|uniref:Uncharacterized protein n=1 Tax=Oharaeibacter diazotrophicus TaxID=1920512 RepID=A0A4R6RJM7_9HYPH|nr:hypothetical protein [Oharaeibacter diazotrophicus]TDP86622.1 hypothetical protein EDD54_0501 [Oharaeibacter diazotrophicus]BBE71436.1 hypothetical protein OHA_1_01010 [Pleomorphomonas sp. SM30]GLS78196.1 hypothetical protein GCM10007904_35330 [Oharaeibacter diazotrophicus]
MDGLTESERRALAYIAEEMAGLVFEEEILDRLESLGLAVRASDDWSLTERGLAVLAAAAAS